MKVNVKCQSGVGMVEIFIVLLVLVIGVFGYVGLQFNVLKSLEEVYLWVMVIFIVCDVLECILVNSGFRVEYLDSDSWNEDVFDVGGVLDNQNVCVSQVCFFVDMVDWDIEMFIWQVVNIMLVGWIVVSLCIMIGVIFSCVIVVWNDQVLVDCFDEDDGVVFGEEIECVVMEVI